jgi:hypothetical protein
MTNRFATYAGAFLFVVGVVGFLVPNFAGLHLSPAHNVVHLISGAASFMVGRKGSPSSARRFCLWFGAVYALLGVSGFISHRPDNTLNVLPGMLVLGTADHIVHVIIGFVYLAVGLARSIPVPSVPKP